MRTLTLSAVLLLAGCASLPASPGMLQPEAKPVANVDAQAKDDAIKQGVQVLLKLQQGKDHAEWPYEGVYRVGGKIPWGYRMGGTAICVSALTEAPGYADDKARVEAVGRAVRFICESKDEPQLAVKDFDPAYDVRSWGHIQAVYTLCRMKQMKLIPEDQAKAVEEAVAFYLDAIQQLEEPKTGGWNYSHPQSGAPSTFMTSNALHALFEAAKAGYKVDPAVVGRGLDFLEKARAASGAIMYAGNARGGRSAPATPCRARWGA